MKKSPDLSGKLGYKNKRDPPNQPARVRKKAKKQVLPLAHARKTINNSDRVTAFTVKLTAFTVKL